MSGPAEISCLVRNSLSGVTVLHVFPPPPAVPVQLNIQYFRLVHTDPLWTGILQARTLSIFVPGEVTAPRMELLTLLS